MPFQQTNPESVILEKAGPVPLSASTLLILTLFRFLFSFSLPPSVSDHHSNIHIKPLVFPSFSQKMGGRLGGRLSISLAMLFLTATSLLRFSSADILQPNAGYLASPTVPYFEFPVQGNVYPHGYFYATVNIGNPPKQYFLDIDTGSDLTWVQCDAGPGSRLLKAPHPPYKPNHNVVFCRDPLCAFVNHPANHPCKAPGDQCDYEVKYADQGSSLGVLVKDSFSLGCTDKPVIRPTLAFGCGYNQQFSGPSPAPYVDGVLGLGSGKPSIVSQLQTLGLTRNVVGHCFSARGGGHLYVGGGFIPAGVNWTRISGKSLESHYSTGPSDLMLGERNAIAKSLYLVFDSGSTYTYLSSQAYQATLSALRAQLKGKPLREVRDGSLPICWKGAKPFRSVAEVGNYFGSLALSYTNAKNVRFILPPEAYLIPTSKGNVCLGIMNSADERLGNLNVIGDISMQDKMLIYDNDKKMVGWAPSNCADVVDKAVDENVWFYR